MEHGKYVQVAFRAPFHFKPRIVYSQVGKHVSVAQNRAFRRAGCASRVQDECRVFLCQFNVRPLRRIGPAEIEDCLLKHPAVGLAAVVGSPDPVRTEIVKAFVVLNADQEPGLELANDIKEFVKTRLAAHEYPREVEFVEELPMTATGKIMRRELKQLEALRKKK